MVDSRRLSTTRSRAKNVVLAMMIATVIAACGGGTAAPASPNPLAFAMTVQNGSGVSGTGDIVRGNGSFTLTIKLTGMPVNSIHISHVHAGGCSRPGGIVFNLQSVAANSSGTATTTTVVPAQYLVPASGWYVNVHFGPDFTEAEYAPSISCGDLLTA